MRCATCAHETRQNPSLSCLPHALPRKKRGASDPFVPSLQLVLFVLSIYVLFFVQYAYSQCRFSSFPPASCMLSNAWTSEAGFGTSLATPPPRRAALPSLLPPLAPIPPSPPCLSPASPAKATARTIEKVPASCRCTTHLPRVGFGTNSASPGGD